MSDCVGSRYDKKEEFQILLSKKDPVVALAPQHNNYMWMARWTKATSSTQPQNDSSCNLLEDLNKRTGSNDSEIMTSEFMKSTVAERFMVGCGSASVQHSRRFSSNMRGLVHDVCKEVGPNNYKHGSRSFERRINKRAVNLHAKEVVSETYSLHKISELPLDLHKLGSSDIQSSDSNHFPMLQINRKIDNILKPKRRSALGPASLNANMSMALSAQEYAVHSHRISDENMDIQKPAGGIVSHLEGPGGLSSDPSGQKLKGHLSDTMSCFCSKDSNSSDCQIDEQHTSHHVADSNHELPFASSGKKFPFAGNVKDQSDAGAFHNQKSRRSDFHKQQDAAGDIFRAPVLGTEFRQEPTTCSYKSKQRGENLDGTFKSHGKAISSLPYEQQFLKTQSTESANLNLPDPDGNTLTVINEYLTHGKESTKNSAATGSCKRRGPCLYEMLTTAPKSLSACPKNSVSSGNGFDVCMYGTNIGSHLFGTQNQSSARTETLYSDTLVVSKSSAGIASSPAEKDCPNGAKTKWLATPSVRRDTYSKGDESHNVNEHHNVSSKATIASKESCMPATGTTDLDLMLFQMSRIRNPISVGVVQAPAGAERSDIWLKRLHPDVLDHEIPSSKRPKVGGSPPCEDSSCFFRMRHRCNNTDYEEPIDHVNEDKVSNEGIKLHNDQISHVPAKSMNYWIGRWCEGGSPVFHGDPGQRGQAKKPDQASEEIGGQFPSIAAMAMMGRAMNKLRPCEHQKKGPLVVWKTE